MSVFRIYSEKKPEFAVEAQSVLNDIKTALRLDIKNIRVLNRYDADRLSEEDFNAAISTVFSEPAVDVVYSELPKLAEGERVFAVEYLPGQFDQRADSCEQCIQILRQGERCRVRNARVYIIDGNITDDEFAKLKSYIINPVESREASLDKVETLDTNYEIPTTVETLEGFINLNEKGLRAFISEFGLAMDYDDIKFCQDYFRNTEHRDPTITEIRMIDTYWSDHCRHTTFSTHIDNVRIHDEAVQASIRMGRMLFGRTHEEFIPMQVLSTILGGYFGSRLMQNLRERNGFTYGVYSAMVNFQQAGYLALATQVGCEVKEAALEEIAREIEALRQKPVSQEELSLVKNIMAGEMMRILDGPFGIADVTTENILCGFDNSHIQQNLERIRQTTPEELQALAQKYLAPEDLVTVVVG